MKTLQDLLKRPDTCPVAREWAGDKSIEDVVATCEWGDWLLWLAEKVGVEKRLLVLAGGLCANTVRHLMRDERSLKGVDMAIAYGRGEAQYSVLSCAQAEAFLAFWDCNVFTVAIAAVESAARSAAGAAMYASVGDAKNAASSAAGASWDIAIWDSDAYTANAAKDASLLKTADIAREVLGEQLIRKVNEMLQ